MYMRTIGSNLLSVIALGWLMLSPLAYSQELQFPVITGYGGVAPLPGAISVIDTTKPQLIVAELVSAANAADQPHQYLNMIARWVNLFSYSGLARDRLHIVVVIHGEAAYSLLNDAAYRAKYGTNNPNTELIQKLSDAGVELLFCGQTLSIRELKKEQIAPQCRFVLSMITALVPYQLRGYAYVKL